VEEYVAMVHSIIHYTLILIIINLIYKTIYKKNKMKEKIIKFEKGPAKKKYTAHVKDKKTGKTRKIHFGASDYPQYKDRTPLKLYAHKNHNTRKRMQNYFSRHSGTKKRGQAISLEKKKSNGYYNPKILSHIYLW
jgi:hypothetical protein